MAMTVQERMARWRERHPDKVREYSQHYAPIVHQRHIELKKRILTHYGNDKCACVRCGESRLACLSIDHIDGGGSQQRRATTLRSTGRFYRWLEQSNYPEGYQTLCMNCQFIKRFERGEHN